MLKVYGSLWLVIVIGAALLLVAGYMTLTTVLAFGFVIFGLVFMGMMGVLPATIAHPDHREQAAGIEKPEPAISRGRVHHAQKSAHA